ncbi:MAG: SAM-dependent methyltransferase, partial [Rhodomicrobium sp.]
MRGRPRRASGKELTAVTGTLYGIGVGPGDPDLITVKAAKILG